MDLIPAHLKKILDPIGRLDFNTSGALILTNDGDLNFKLSHPKFSVKKIYLNLYWNSYCIVLIRWNIIFDGIKKWGSLPRPVAI